MADTQLLDRLEVAVRQHRSGISEYALMQWLDQDEQAPFSKPDMLDSWQLFRSHFWLFHHLYLLRLHLANEHETLDIVATRIVLYQTDAGSSADRTLARTDPMQGYYLDLDNLERETPDSLQEKLNAFWQRLQDPDKVAADWALFELQPPVSKERLRTRYRQLCQRHHPDRGGDARQFRHIQAAYARLKSSGQ